MFYAVGTNQYDIDGKGTSLHAEMDAVQKLKENSRFGSTTKKPKKIIVIVFRVNIKNVLEYSNFKKDGADIISRTGSFNSL